MFYLNVYSCLDAPLPRSLIIFLLLSLVLSFRNPFLGSLSPIHLLAFLPVRSHLHPYSPAPDFCSSLPPRFVFHFFTGSATSSLSRFGKPFSVIFCFCWGLMIDFPPSLHLNCYGVNLFLFRVSFIRALL